MDSGVGVVLFVVLCIERLAYSNQEERIRGGESSHLDASGRLFCSVDPFFEHLLVILRPLAHRQLGDFDGVIVELADDTSTLELVRRDALNGTLCGRGRLRGKV